MQQVRDLERLGVLPPAVRRPNGYRSFGSTHAAALRAYRQLAEAAGPVEARAVLRDVWTLPLDQAVARIVLLHVALAEARTAALAGLEALDRIVDEARSEAPARPEDAMTITELADAIGVRTSTLRFWEAERLLTAERVSERGRRRYLLSAIRVARVIAALRAAGYGIPAIREVLPSIGALDERRARDALELRLQTIARQSLGLVAAGSDIVKLLEREP